mmetsp:Transcript_271/g.314  ORF Transcript_271/g.314 Transcript_271/m.314 type:complete len:258 (+) Transcript_271:34-807(+)
MSLPSLNKEIDPVNQENDFVHTVYNEIAPHFSQTRYKPWPIVEKFLLNQKDYSIGLDVGCGNGKYLSVNKKLFIIGTDRSDGLIDCAKKLSNNTYNVGVADGLNLPHPSNTFDFAISIAVIHHFATVERRILAIKHILEKMRSGGEVLIYCWALEQENSRRGYKEGDDQDILIPWVLQNKQPKKDKAKGNCRKKDQQSDSSLVIKEEQKPDAPETKYRYYHLYKKGELVDNALAAGGCSLVDQGYEKDNWWVIIRKD